jgi:hypothetical protein
MDQLTLFGLLAVTAMLIFYALEDRSPWFIWRSQAHVLSGRFTASYKARGPSE